MPAAALPFIIGGIGAAGSIATGIIGSNAAGKAADAQVSAANNAAALQKQAADEALSFNKLQYGNSLNMSSPWVNTGQSALQRLSQLMGIRPNQGLPPGVVNPNAPPSGAGGGYANTGSLLDLIRSGGLGPAFENGAASGALGARGNAPVPMRAQAFNAPAGAAAGAALPGQNFGVNPAAGAQDPGAATGPLTGPNAGLGPPQQAGAPGDPNSISGNGLINAGIGPSGAAGMLGANGQPLPEAQQPGNVGNLGGVGANGLPDPSQFLGDPSPVGPGGVGDMGNVQNPTPANGSPGQVPRTDGGTSGDPADFGSLARGFDEQFKAPTDVTEQNDPGYQFRLKQGQDAIERSAAARGGLLSGGTAKSLSDYNQGSASAEYGNVYGRAASEYERRYNIFKQNQNDLFNRFATLSGVGQTTAGQLNSAGLQSASNAGNILLTSAGQIGQNINNAGAARGSGYVGSANAINGAITGGANGLSTLALLQAMKNNG